MNPYNRLVPPPESPNTPADPQYEEFYGLSEQPFAISTDPKFLFLSASHQRAYQELLTGLQRHEGLLLLTGEAGTGKTTLCRGVIEALGERVFSAILLNPYMSGAELLKVVLKEFGLVTREELRRGALARAEPPQLLDAIEGFLLSVRSVESRAVIVVDEAQSLSPPVLDQVRLLTALERQGKPLLQIIIGGQPKLIETLKKDVMYALSERITRRVHLAPLLADEVHAYINHRLSVAGGADSVEFLPEATTVVAELSRGLPRRVNLLCDRALQQGRIEQSRKVTADMIRRAARSLAGAQPRTDAPTDSIADGLPEATAASVAAAAAVPPPPPKPEPAPASRTPAEPLPAEAAASAFKGEIFTGGGGRTFFDVPDTGGAERDADVGPPDGARRAGEADQLPGAAAADALMRKLKDADRDRADADRDEPAIVFGQGEQERARRRRLMLIALVIVVLGGLAYGYFAMTVVQAASPFPPVTPPPRVEAPPWPAALPVLPEEVVADGLRQLRLMIIMELRGGGGG